MQEGDIVNIKGTNGFWKGEIYSVSDGLEDGPMYKQPIVSIRELNGSGRSTALEKNLEFRDGEYWELRK